MSLRLLFLDIDGVLNDHALDRRAMSCRLDRDKVDTLNVVLAETDARIVLSSAWRYMILRGEMTLAGFNWLLRSHGVMCGRLVGHTRPDKMVPNPFYDGMRGTWPENPVPDERGEQIAEYLSTCVGTLGQPCSAYAVVDDLDLGITIAGHPFVRTDGSVGLTQGDAMKLIELLNRPRK